MLRLQLLPFFVDSYHVTNLGPLHPVLIVGLESDQADVI